MIVAAIAGLLAALVHGYIFVIESLRFERPSTLATFGIHSAADAAIMKPWAFNQGFYNLFLGIVATTGAIVMLAGQASPAGELVGRTLLWAGTGCMLGAATVLIASDRAKLRAALVQGVFPLITVIALVVALLLG